MINKWKTVLPELTGSEERNVYLYLPESYCYSDKRYPVLYMFDGHNVFFDSDATYGKSWGMKEYMDRTSTQMIIAAVECNHSPDHGRLREYTPFPFCDAKVGQINALGSKTMDWILHTFKPEIDRNYRTLPDRSHTFIAGSSMGGLMSLYAVLKYNAWFSRAAALSPSIWVAPQKLEQLVKDCPLASDTVVYLDYGELELKKRPGIVRQFSHLSSVLMDHGVLTNSRIIPKGSHCEASWERQIPIFMQILEYNGAEI